MPGLDLHEQDAKRIVLIVRRHCVGGELLHQDRRGTHCDDANPCDDRMASTPCVQHPSILGRLERIAWLRLERGIHQDSHSGGKASWVRKDTVGYRTGPALAEASGISRWFGR